MACWHAASTSPASASQVRWRDRAARGDALPSSAHNPILTAADVPYPANSAFNPAAARLEGETVSGRADGTSLGAVLGPVGVLGALEDHRAGHVDIRTAAILAGTRRALFN